ncbi:MAG: transposase [Candidatus Dormibacteria bacterium]
MRRELRAFLPDDAACLAHLERFWWPIGFRCPRCGGAGCPCQGTH